MVQRIVDILLGVPVGLALVIIAALVFGEAALFFGFVIPGETAVVYGGVLAAAGKVSVVVVLLVVIAAAIIGDSVGFEVGRKLGPRLVRAPVLRSHPDRVDAAQAYLRRRGGRAVVAGRFTAFLRAVMPALAGASRMEYPRFLAFNAVGGVLWGSACVLLGYFAAHSISKVTHYLGLTSGVIVVLILVGLAWAWHRRNRDE
jgi:membrane-associated protein